MSEWWQIVYTSADLGDGTAGGWGVKYASPAEARDHADALLSGVDTRMESDELGNFPTAEVLARRTRCLVARMSPQGMLLIHTVPAGADATGRPGNVLVHAVVCLDQPEATAIEYWRSADWLVPFGAAAIRDVRLPTRLRPGAAVDRSSVADFLTVPGRFQILSVVLERLFPERMPDPAPVVVLLVEGAEEAALWIGAVTFMRDPRSDGDNAWSTWSRPEALDELCTSGVRLIGVARKDAQDTFSWARGRPHVIVVDTTARYQRSGGSWTGADGAVVAEAGWASELLACVAAGAIEFGAEVIADLMRDVVALSEESSTDFQDPLWALAAAELLDPDLAVSGRDEQTEAVLRFGPQRIRPRAFNAAIDQWWRSSEQVIKAMLPSWRVVPGPLLERRVVLLMAGDLQWDDDIDGQWTLSDANLDAIGVETENAVRRLSALLDLDPPQREEASAILRVLAGWDLAREDARVDAAHGRLGGVWRGLRRPSVDPRASTLTAATMDVPLPPDQHEVPAEASTRTVGRSQWPGPSQSHRERPPVGAPAAWAPTSAPTVADHLAEATPTRPSSPDPPLVTRSAATMRSTVTPPRLGAPADLVNDWVEAMVAASRRPATAFSRRAELERVLDYTPHDEVAAHMLQLPDSVLHEVLLSAMSIEKHKGPQSPFGLGATPYPTQSYLFAVACHVFAQMRKEFQSPQTPRREWTLDYWDDQIQRHKSKSKAYGLLWQAWTSNAHGKG